jgi:hypothetical protein
MELDPPEYNNNNILLKESFISAPDQYNGNMSNTTTYLITIQTLV